MTLTIPDTNDFIGPQSSFHNISGSVPNYLDFFPFKWDLYSLCSGLRCHRKRKGAGAGHGWKDFPFSGKALCEFSRMSFTSEGFGSQARLCCCLGTCMVLSLVLEWVGQQDDGLEQSISAPVAHWNHL